MAYTMELAGIIDIGKSSQALGPADIKYIFVKGQEVCDTHFVYYTVAEINSTPRNLSNSRERANSGSSIRHTKPSSNPKHLWNSLDRGQRKLLTILCRERLEGSRRP